MTNAYWPVAEPDGLGPLIGADDVRDAVASTIATWSPYYLAMLSDRLTAGNRIGPSGPLNGQGQPIIPAPLPAFGSWINEASFRSIGTGIPAAHAVRCPGTAERPDRHGNGTWTAVYSAIVEVQVFGLDWSMAADLTSWYEKAVRWSVMQHRSLGGFATSTRWMGTSLSGDANAQHSSSRVEGKALIRFDVTVLDVIEDNRGPATVPAQPWSLPGDDPTASTITTTLSKTPVNQPLP